MMADGTLNEYDQARPVASTGGEDADVSEGSEELGEVYGPEDHEEMGKCRVFTTARWRSHQHKGDSTRRCGVSSSFRNDVLLSTRVTTGHKMK